MSKLMAFYLLEKGGNELPKAREAITAIATLSQRHFLKHLGQTFELDDPFVRVMEGPFTAGEKIESISKAFEFLLERLTDEINVQKNAMLIVVQGAHGDNLGVNRVAQISGGNWEAAHRCFVDTPQLLSRQDFLVWPHELGHAYGLPHTDDTAKLFEKEDISLGVRPSLTMQRKDVPLNTLYEHGFHVAERSMLTDITFHQDKLKLWVDPVLRPAQALSRRTVSPLPMGLPAALNEWTPGDLTMSFDIGGSRDLFFVKRRQTGSGFVEVHTLSAASGYNTFSASEPAIIPESDEASGDFLVGGGQSLADVLDGEEAFGKPDLFFIKRTNTADGNGDLSANRDRRIELIQVSGESGFQEITLNRRTVLAQIEDSHGDFLMADFDRNFMPDLYFIKRRLTGSGKIEVHVVSGNSSYQSFALQVPTPLDAREDRNGDFLLGDFDGDRIPDLYYIKRRNTGGSIEVHILSGASRYSQFVEQIGTPLSADHDRLGVYACGDFNGDGRSDLCFIKRDETGSGSMEIHVLSARSRFQQFIIQKPVPLLAMATSA